MGIKSSVVPEYKRQGYGTALLRYALLKAKEMDYGAVFMEGNIDFYRHSGFVLASSLNIHYHAEPRESEVPYFLGQELKPGYLESMEGMASLQNRDMIHRLCPIQFHSSRPMP